MRTLIWISAVALALVAVSNAQPEKPRPAEMDRVRDTRRAPNEKGRPGPPPNWKKIVNPFENATDADLPAPRVHVRARTRQRPTLTHNLNGAKEQETVRGLLAEYRKKAAAKLHRRGRQGGNRTVEVPEELKQQHRMRLAEQKASGFVPPPTITEINAALNEDLFDGDILLTPEQAQSLLNEVSEEEEEEGGGGGGGGQGGSSGSGSNNATVAPKRQKRGALNFATYTGSKWPLYPAQIPYAFDSTIDSERKAQIMKAINYYFLNTCFDFVETTPTDTTKTLPIIVFTRGNGCFSNLGKKGSSTTQTLSIGTNCERIGTVLHEIYHALGSFHTQARHDRENFVNVDWSKIQDNEESQYAIQTPTTNDNQGVQYDYGSAMHYSANSFADNSNVPGMTAIEPYMSQTMGQREALAFSDLVMLNKAYGCGSCSATDIARCQNGGIPNPNWCDQCICPKGFEGSSCTTRQAATSNAKSSPGGSACGGSYTATTSWQYLSGTLDSGVTSSAYSPYESCHYHFNAPAGKTVWVWVNSISSNACSTGCPSSSVEVKYNDFTRAGIRLCCQSDLGSSGYIQVGGVTNKLVVSIVSKGPAQSFGLYYIYV